MELVRRHKTGPKKAHPLGGGTPPMGGEIYLGCSELVLHLLEVGKTISLFHAYPPCNGPSPG